VSAILNCIHINPVYRTVHMSINWSYSICFIDVIDMLTEFDMGDFCLRLLYALYSRRYRCIKIPVYVKPYVCFAVHSVRQLLQVNITHHHAASVSTERFIFCWHATVRHHDVSAVNYKLHPTVQFFQSCSELAWSPYEWWVCHRKLKMQRVFL
jgi:hypothetical protein